MKNIQTCSLEQSKKLKKLGVKQFAYVYHYMPTHNIMGEKKGQPCLRHAGIQPNYPKGWDNYWAAFTVSELGEMLPEWVYSKKNSGGGEKWVCMMVEGHIALPKKIRLKDFYAKEEAGARAEMLIHLLKSKLISITKLNRAVAK